MPNMLAAVFRYDYQYDQYHPCYMFRRISDQIGPRKKRGGESPRRGKCSRCIACRREEQTVRRDQGNRIMYVETRSKYMELENRKEKDNKLMNS